MLGPFILISRQTFPRPALSILSGRQLIKWSRVPEQRSPLISDRAERRRESDSSSQGPQCFVKSHEISAVSLTDKRLESRNQSNMSGKEQTLDYVETFCVTKKDIQVICWRGSRMLDKKLAKAIYSTDDDPCGLINHSPLHTLVSSVSCYRRVAR